MFKRFESCSRRFVLKSALAAPFGVAASATAGVAVDQLPAAARELTEADGFKIHPYQNSAMRGSPPAEKDVVTLDNRLDNRAKHQWALQHARELMPTQSIVRGIGPPAEWQRRPLTVAKFNATTFATTDGKQTTVKAFLDEQSVDALVVVHQGAIVNEQYFHGMTPGTPHELYSLGKSLVGTLVGSLLGKELSETEKIERYLPELAGTAYAGVSIRDLLDMKSGLDFSYSFVDANSEMARYGDLSRGTPKNQPAQGQIEFLKTIQRIRPAGEKMRYKETDVAAAAFAAERTTGRRLADLLSERIWSLLAAEHDAYVRCDGLGGAMPSMGLSATARDLARWGQMCLDDGAIHGRQVVPATFFADLRRGRTLQVDVDDCISGVTNLRMPQGTAYHNFFWFPPGQSQAALASGAFGQTCYINWTHQTVLVLFSSWIMVGDNWTTLTAELWHACEQISQLVARRGG